MYNKKGGGHVDWIISIGIFLIYLLGMFILIKPGVIPIHDSETLLDILEEKVREDSMLKFSPKVEVGGLYWTLYKVPLFIKKSPNTGCMKINFPYKIEDEDGNNKITDSKINVYKISIDPNGERIIEIVQKKLSVDSLYIQDTFSDLTKKYFIFFSGNQVYDSTIQEIKDLIISEVPISSDITVDISECEYNDPNNPFIYELGISEKIRGVSKFFLEYLIKPENKELSVYTNIKEIYNYPKSKECSITIADGDVVKEYLVVEPDSKTNVYTRQWSDFILNYDGMRSPIKIILRVW